MTARWRAGLIWAALAVALTLPVAAAATSPYLAWRDPVYIAAGFAGIIAMALLPVQPLLMAGLLPGLTGPRARRAHARIGGALALCIALHVGGLWITSPPDVIDALLFVSPTPFSVWGVLAMWAVGAILALAALRRRLRPAIWRRAHGALAAILVGGTVLHALLVEGAMEQVTKTALAVLILASALVLLRDRLGRSR
jgi:hypothetical protein